MNRTFLMYAGAAAAVVALAVVSSRFAPADVEAVAAPTTIRVAADQLRYPPGSQQLAYLSIQAVTASVPPLVEPLPARLVPDEDHTVRVFSPLPGRVVEVVARPGQAVKAGEVLAWLVAPDAAAAVADVRKAEADRDSRDAAWRRAQGLSEAGVIATRELETARAEARVAQAELERASARVHSLGPVGADGRFALRAPLAGMVTSRQLNPGQELRPDAPEPAFVISDPARIDVLADVPQAEANVLRVGQAVRIEDDAHALTPMDGRIVHVSGVLDPATRRVAVRAHIEKPVPGARPELFVRLAPLADGAEPAVVVPNSALVTVGVQDFVFVERSPGLLARTAVTLAHRGREVSHVRAGLRPGDRVVTQGAVLLEAELASDD
ncbi:efflux RND transporter periplasmic adaptor subunit [Aquabacterium sp.]|uniref:efflux RND transporter periplasmic adaptor subunit n=2 Tax=Aquabacterium TaxID=92793 RepID=UPI0035C6A345